MSPYPFKTNRKQALAAPRLVIHLCVTVLLLVASQLVMAATTDDTYPFDDSQLDEPLKYPEWFVLSSGDLRDDLQDALDNGKQGLIVYFGQKRCSYCDQFMKVDLGKPDIETYLRKHFDVIPIDIWGIEDIIDTDGQTYTERELSIQFQTNFTPSLIFYDSEGNKVFRLRGFYPPYKFRAALQYVVGGFYTDETFRDYLARAEPGMFFQEGGMNERDFFLPPPVMIDRSTTPGTRPLAVFFEQGDCHACDLLHSGPLNDPRAIEELEKMDVVQVNMADENPITRPDGKVTTPREWANELALFHSPSVLFFDEHGREIIRVDSVVQFYRMWGVLDFVNRRGYETEPDYQSWRLKQRDIAPR